MRLITCGALIFLTSLSALAQNSQVKDAWSALQGDFSSLSNVDVKFTTTKVRSNGNTTDEFENELKVRGDHFWFRQVPKSPSGTSNDLSRTIAYDGKVYQSVGDAGYCIKESKPNLTNIQSLAATPLVRIYTFVRPNDWRDTNAFAFLGNPKNWIKFSDSSANAGSETVDGVNLLTMTVKSTNGDYQVTMRPDLNYFPVSWRTVNGVGFPVTVQCSSFKNFPVTGGTISFPTKITDVLTKPDGTTVVSTVTVVESIKPLTTAKSDNSDFQIDTSSMRIYDQDNHKFVK